MQSLPYRPHYAAAMVRTQLPAYPDAWVSTVYTAVRSSLVILGARSRPSVQAYVWLLVLALSHMHCRAR